MVVVDDLESLPFVETGRIGYLGEGVDFRNIKRLKEGLWKPVGNEKVLLILKVPLPLIEIHLNRVFFPSENCSFSEGQRVCRDVGNTGKGGLLTGSTKGRYFTPSTRKGPALIWSSHVPQNWEHVGVAVPSSGARVERFAGRPPRFHLLERAHCMALHSKASLE